MKLSFVIQCYILSPCVIEHSSVFHSTTDEKFILWNGLCLQKFVVTMVILLSNKVGTDDVLAFIQLRVVNKANSP
jgi:hypothetical protein